ncbi:hypothetical protein LCGC14_2214430 [marine sediment metagenome]|uniref:Uncharacterized protein n=1 Tax=marine sediment metagenome TaxID=412755 RepID=A0A0F9DD02_9ZZZZ
MTKRWCEPFEVATARHREKNRDILGRIVEAGGTKWKLADFNDLGVPYFRQQLKSGGFSKQHYTLACGDTLVEDLRRALSDHAEKQSSP